MEREIIKKIKTKNYSCFLTSYDNKFTIEYSDKSKTKHELTMMQTTDYESLKKAEFNFNLLVDSILSRDFENVKEYILYIQNAKHTNKKPL